jgi:hypothetical protein
VAGDVNQQLIEFHTLQHVMEVFPRPYPASRELPKWLHDMPVEGAPGVSTVKRCPPFLEAMTLGYIIPLPCDVKLIMKPDRLEVQVPEHGCAPLIELHVQAQFPGAPFGNAPIIKFRNPWIIKTPPGYSTLVLPPMNRPGSPIQPLSAVVETDTYYRNITFPAICLLRPNSEVLLPRGTPLVQVIPFRRDEWSSECVAADSSAHMKQNEHLSANPHMYKDQHWKKKTYV